MRPFLPLLLCILPALAFSGETPIPASPTGWVTDAAGLMSPQAARALDTRLGAYERSSGRQLFIYIGKTTGGVPIEDWAVKAFKTWHVGRKGLDNGVVLFIMIGDRRERIEVGYSLEAQLTDALTSRILNDVIRPKLLANDPDGAVTSGADAIVNVLDGKPLPAANPSAAAPRAPSKPLGFWQFVLIAIVGIAFLALLVTHPDIALYLLINILSNAQGGSSGGSGGGGNGFSGGGGGRSGGGGASGSW